MAATGDNQAVTPLRIGIDARELLGDPTGVGRYLGELLRRWTSRADAGTRRLVLYTPEPLAMAFPAATVEQRLIGGGRGTWWEQTSLRRAVKREPLDAFFAPAYTAPLGVRVPLAVTIHDVSFVAHPEWFRPREGLRRRWLTARAAGTASVIFTDSEFSRSEIESRLHIRAGKIHVIPPGVAVRHGHHVQRPIAVPGQPLVLYVGSLFNRRRLPQLIAAFAEATHDMPQARLTIVGDDRTWPPQDLRDEIDRRNVAARVELLNYVDDESLASLYGEATLFAFLSEYEGFGLTPLEALAAGVPVVVLDTPVAREVYGPAAMYVAPDDPAGATERIRAVLRDPSTARPALSHAEAVLARYSWDRAAEETLRHIERIARAGG
jgi:glycosyltransferase involved in cell wall biosynthesis